MNKHIKKLYELCLKNPDVEIVCAVDNEVVVKGCGHWKAKIETVEIEYIYNTAVGFIMGENSIIDYLIFCYEDKYDNSSKEEFNKKIENIYNTKKESGDIKKYIIIRIGV